MVAWRIDWSAASRTSSDRIVGSGKTGISRGSASRTAMTTKTISSSLTAPLPSAFGRLLEEHAEELVAGDDSASATPVSV